MKQHGLILLLALAALGLIYFSRRAASVPATSTEQPGASQNGPDTTDVSSADLSGYPIHGAPALPLSEGSLTNYFADFPSEITAGSSSSTPAAAPATSTTPKSPTQTVNQELGTWGLGQGFIAAESANKQATLAEQALVPGLAGVGLKGSNASGGFLSAGGFAAELVSFLSSAYASIADSVGAGHQLQVT